MPAEKLFRRAALQAQHVAPHGEIVLVRPVSFAVWAVAAAIAAGALAAFFVWGTYTAHSTMSGQLVPRGGVAKVHAPQPGVIASAHVAEGQSVAAGELLFVLSSERLSSTGATQAEIAAELHTRIETLEDERDRLRLLEETRASALQHSIDAMRREAAASQAITQSQHARVALAEEQAARYAALHAEGFVPREQLIARQADAAEQRLRLQTFERDRRQAELRVAELESELARSRIEHENRAAELVRALAATRQELIETEARRSVRVVAPTPGVATNVTAEVGQATDGTRPLVSIVPMTASLHAELLAPSRAVGFVKPGDVVLLRYHAYPYQRFGHHRGTVVSVSRAPFAPGELSPSFASPAEPLYRLTVALPAQTIDVYGTAQPLHAGMRVEADVLQDTRRLYEWVLAPLHALGGRRR